MNHITLVSVTTDANVPINTATEAGSIQVSFWRAITNTLSAGGSDAIRTAVAAQGCGNGPNSSINPNTTSGWIRSLIAMTPGHLPGHAAERAQRHRHAEHEQRHRRGGVLQEQQRIVDRDRRMEVQRGRAAPRRRPTGSAD